jgi:hypothetical protein
MRSLMTGMLFVYLLSRASALAASPSPQLTYYATFNYPQVELRS